MIRLQVGTLVLTRPLTKFEMLLLGYYKQDVEGWCQTCNVCNAKKGPSGKGKSPLQIYNVRTLFEKIQMDILGSLSSSASGNRFLLVIVDSQSTHSVTAM